AEGLGPPSEVCSLAMTRYLFSSPLFASPKSVASKVITDSPSGLLPSVNEEINRRCSSCFGDGTGVGTTGPRFSITGPGCLASAMPARKPARTARGIIFARMVHLRIRPPAGKPEGPCRGSPPLRNADGDLGLVADITECVFDAHFEPRDTGLEGDLATDRRHAAVLLRTGELVDEAVVVERVERAGGVARLVNVEPAAEIQDRVVRTRRAVVGE